MPVPENPKIYHIIHFDRLPSIIENGCLWCDAEMEKRPPAGTKIGMQNIKDNRLNLRRLTSHPDLYVGGCVPFYFCPRSVMLRVIYHANSPKLSFHGGQGSIIHLEADYYQASSWAEKNNLRWAFTTSNAGSFYFDDFADHSQLEEVNWDAVQAKWWNEPVLTEGKQAEFLIENSFPWELVSRIGVNSYTIFEQVSKTLSGANHKPLVQIMSDWYY